MVMQKRFVQVDGQSMAKAWTLLALLFVPMSCSQGPVCAELASCGGDILDKWAQLPRGEETPGSYCQEIVHTPPIESHLRSQLHPTARNRLPEKTNADWCSELVVTGDNNEPIKSHLYWWEDLPYIEGFLQYHPNDTYDAGLTRKANVERWYSQTCLRKYGYAGDCKALQEDFEKANQGAGEFNGFQCVENAKRGGCSCTFEIFEVNKIFGRYSISGSTITHFPSTPTGHFSQASFCVKGDTIQISGKNNSYLWDRPGLRTIEMVRMNCNDGKAGPGELGVDCGLGCPNPCPAQ